MEEERSRIDRLILKGRYTEAYACLIEYIDTYGEDGWAKHSLAIVKSKL